MSYRATREARIAEEKRIEMEKLSSKEGTQLPTRKKKVRAPPQNQPELKIVDGEKHATIPEMEIQIASYGAQLGNMLLEWEQFKVGLTNQITPELKTTIISLAEYIADKNPKRNGIAKQKWQDAKRILKALSHTLL